MDHTENSLRAVVSTLRTVVAPAVDAGDALAQQQLGLSVLYLEFLASRLAYLPDRDRLEVEQNARLADAVSAAAGADAAPGLVGAAARARDLLVAPRASRHELQQAAAGVAARVSELVESDLPDDVRRAVEAAVVAGSVERVEFERAWYAPMGFDPDPASVRPLAERLEERT